MYGEMEFAKKLAYDAGEIMKKYFNQKDIGDKYKGEDDKKTIVTLADTEINQMVIDQVREKYPEHGVFGEEDSFGNDRKILWVCDPVDGTAMFSCGVPVSVFSLALVIDGESKLGVVYDPFKDEIYTAIKGEGAYCNSNKLSVNTEKLGDVSAISNYDSSSRYVSSSRTYQKDLRPAVDLLDRETYLTSIGSIIRASMLVASGNMVAEITAVSGNKNMDVAAVKVIVEEAGGKVTDIFGNEQRYDQDIKGAIISNSVVHDELVNAVKNNMV